MDHSDAPENDNRAVRILIVDDEPRIRAPLAHALRATRYTVDEADSGKEALSKLEISPYDVMLLDLRMPGIGGVDVMKRAHKMCPDLLVVILTGYATLDSAIAAVRSEAVDYLLKPVSVHQVTDTVGRVLAERQFHQQQQLLVHTISQATEVLRQRESPANPMDFYPAWDKVLHCPPLLLDTKRQALEVQGGEDTVTYELTKNETVVLAVLMSHVNRVFTCEQLIRQALGFEYDPAEARSTLRPIIFRLRQKIEDNPKHPRLIRTVRGSGYFLSLEQD